MAEPYEPALKVGYQTIQVERVGRVGVVRWNRPERLNAMSKTLQAEWIEAYDAFNSDPGIGAVVTTGNGRAYSSGADISEFESTFSGSGVTAGKLPPHEPFDPWYMADGKPTIAAVNGLAVGIGLTSIIWYDGIVASTEATFSARFAAIGLTPELLSTWLLPRIVGVRAAKEMMLTGRIWTAAEAQDLGLVREVVEPDQLLDRSIALAASIAANPDPTVRIIKRMIMEDLLTSDLSTVQRRSTSRFAESRRSPEHWEGLRAFREKREPRYHDREYMAEITGRLQAPQTS